MFKRWMKFNYVYYLFSTHRSECPVPWTQMRSATSRWTARNREQHQQRRIKQKVMKPRKRNKYFSHNFFFRLSNFLLHLTLSLLSLFPAPLLIILMASPPPPHPGWIMKRGGGWIIRIIRGGRGGAALWKLFRVALFLQNGLI